MKPSAPECLQCARFNDSDTTLDCLAFPGGIPDDIILGKIKHRKPYSGDNGLQFIRQSESLLEAESTKALKVATDPRESAESRLLASLEALFVSLLPDVADRLAKGELPSDEELSAAFSKVLQPELATLATEEFERLGVQVGVQFDPAQGSLAMQEWAASYTFDLVRDLTETTRKVLQSAMSQYAATPGMTRGQLEALLEPAFGKVRAEAISQTEVTRAFSASQEQYQQQLAEQGIQMERVWRTHRDELVCPQCGPLDGKPESEWGGVGPPPRHVRCRCATYLELAPEGTKYNPYHDRLGRFTSRGSAGGAGGRAMSTLGKQVQDRVAQGFHSSRDAVEVGQIVQKAMAEALAPYERQLERAQARNRDSMHKILETDLSKATDAQRARLMAQTMKATRSESKASIKYEEVKAQLAREALGQVRQMGLPPEGIALYSKYASGEGAKVHEAIKQTADNYPRAWWEASNQAGTLKLQVKGQAGVQGQQRDSAYYAHGTTNAGGGTISFTSTHLSTPETAHDTAIHEVGHRFEYAIPKAKGLAMEFYDHRTAGEQARPLGPGYATHEMTRPDKFYDPYCGKVYPDRATEVLSMGFESLFGSGRHAGKVKADPEHEQFILGLLAGL